MNSLFDDIIDRTSTNSVKWAKPFLEEQFGVSDIFPVWLADMDFRSPDCVVSALLETVKQGVFGYAGITPEYQIAVQGWMERRFQWNIQTEDICFAPGIVPALSAIVRCFSNEGDGIVIQPPIYYPFYKCVEKNNRQLLPNPLILENGRYEINFQELEQLLSKKNTKLMFLCHPHNPSGRVWTNDELSKISALCIQHNVIIVCDEIHHDLVFPWTDFSTLNKSCPEAINHSIVCTSSTKTFNLAGLQGADIIIQSDEIRKLFKNELLRSGLDRCPLLGLTATIAAYNEGEPWLNSLVDYLVENHHYLTEQLHNKMPGVIPMKLDATYLAWLDLREYGDFNTLYDKIIKIGKLGVTKGTIFGSEGQGFIRLNFACPRTQLEIALDRLHRALI